MALLQSPGLLLILLRHVLVHLSMQSAALVESHQHDHADVTKRFAIHGNRFVLDGEPFRIISCEYDPCTFVPITVA